MSTSDVFRTGVTSRPPMIAPTIESRAFWISCGVFVAMPPGLMSGSERSF